MAIEIKEAKRVFQVTGPGTCFVFPDPHPLMAPAMVLQHYIPHFPQLKDASPLPPRIDHGSIIHEFVLK